jgi:hypothetical protein
MDILKYIIEADENRKKEYVKDILFLTQWYYKTKEKAVEWILEKVFPIRSQGESYLSSLAESFYKREQYKEEIVQDMEKLEGFLLGLKLDNLVDIYVNLERICQNKYFEE